LASPSLATYRAPEELEAGSSTLSGYFDPDGEFTLSEEYLQLSTDEDTDDESDQEDLASNVAAKGKDDEKDALLFLDDDDDSAEDGEGEDEGDEDDDDEEIDFEMVADHEWEADLNPEANEDARGIRPGPPQQAPADPVPAVDVGDEVDGNVEDDMEGAMEGEHRTTVCC
jgi:E3 ubiquitin-protein ligase MARCH6